jgi:hypothetical protein
MNNNPQQQPPHNILEETETWRLEYSYGRLGPSLSICFIYCNSLEECQAQYQHVLQHSSSPPLWANAVHSIERHTEETTVFVLKLIEPPQEQESRN